MSSFMMSSEQVGNHLLFEGEYEEKEIKLLLLCRLDQKRSESQLCNNIKGNK